jgi:hypothetical protein
MDEKIELAWLGGIIDGEGSIGVFLHAQVKDGVRFTTWRPNIQITNTHPRIIDRCCTILTRQNVEFSAHVRSRVNDHWKQTTDIAMMGLRRCERAIPVLRPYVYAKARNLELLDQLVQSRLRRMRGKRQPRLGGGSILPPFSAEELALVAAIQEANRLGPVDQAEEIV